MFVVVNSVSIADASENRYEMDVRDHADQYLVGQPGFRRLELLHPESDGDYLLLAYWDSEEAFEQWAETDDFEAAHEELFGAMFLDPEHVDRYESATTLEAPDARATRFSGGCGRRSRQDRVSYPRNSCVWRG